MMDFIFVPLVVGVITLGIYKFFELLVCRRERRMIIEELQSDVLDQFAARMQGQLLDVLCEGWDGETGLYYGRSYADSQDIDARVLFDSAFSVEEGDFVPVRITGAQGADLTGSTERAQ